MKIRLCSLRRAASATTPRQFDLTEVTVNQIVIAVVATCRGRSVMIDGELAPRGLVTDTVARSHVVALSVCHGDYV